MSWLINLTLFILFFSCVNYVSGDVKGRAKKLESTSFVTNSKTKLKILGVFGHPGKSHFDFFLPLLEELARRGHELTVISQFPRSNASKSEEPLPNYVDIDVTNLEIGVFVNVVDLKTIVHSKTWLVHELGILKFMATLACETGLRHPKVREFLKSDVKFDLILTEAFNTDCFLGFVHRFQVPFIALSSHQIMPWVTRRMDDPHDKSQVPAILLGLKRPMEFWDRLCNTLTWYIANAVYDYWYCPDSQKLVEETFGPGVPDIQEIAKNTSLVLLNTHYSIHGVRPHLPQVVEVGGLHIPSTTKPLPNDISKFLDDATEGVLYFNLGSMVKASSLPQEKLDAILAVIGSIPRKVIWKWEVDDLPKKPENVMVKKWLPQFDILNHPNVKCYLGHGGLLGLSEGIYVGVPMVLIPMYGDQFHNAAAAEARGTAIVLEYDSLNERTLRNALDNIFNDTRYRENAAKVSKAYRDRPMNPLETAVWWTEHIGRGNSLPYLRSEGANLSWYQRNLLDVALFLIVISLLVLYFFYRLIKLLVSSIVLALKKLNGNKTMPGVKNGKLKKKD